jgi:predicted amidohydrolase
MEISKFKVAGVQMDIHLADASRNLKAMQEKLREATSAGAQLTVFPECTTTGYCFESLNEAVEVAQPLMGENFQCVHQMCVELDTMVVFGFLELVEEGVYNTVAMVGPSGLIASYRKIHLPFLGVDRFTLPGDRPFTVVDTAIARIGLNICYDSSFPEAARALAIEGADLIALPTNWPPTSGLAAEFIPNARALENHVYFMAINRIGSERGIDFVGKSKICDPTGRSLAFANHAREEILFAEIDPQFARQKHLVNIPGVHEVDRLRDRRPEFYGPLSKPVSDLQQP